MKLKDVEPIINKYFTNITPEEIIKMFEEMGLEFEDIDETNENKQLNIGFVTNCTLRCNRCGAIYTLDAGETLGCCVALATHRTSLMCGGQLIRIA